MRTRANRLGREVNIHWKDEAFDCALSRSNAKCGVLGRLSFRRSCTVGSKAPGPGALQDASRDSKALSNSLAWRLRHRGFTLIELLIVMAIISILAALLLPTLSVMKQRAKINLARTEMASIQSAILAYQSAYGRMPTPSTAISGDFTFGPTGFGSTVGSYSANNSELMAILMDMDQLSNARHALNPRHLSFFSANRARSTNDAGLGPDLVLRDPWGNPYIITIDFDYNNRCQDAIYGNAAVSADPSSPTAGYKGLFRTPPSATYELAAPIMIWSMGPDGKESATVSAISGVNADNILSWSK